MGTGEGCQNAADARHLCDQASVDGQFHSSSQAVAPRGQLEELEFVL
jgi:hypothetical protein